MTRACVLGAGVAFLWATASVAAVTTAGLTFAEAVVVDGSTAIRQVLVAEDLTITDVDVTVTFTVCGGIIGQAGNCILAEDDDGFTFNDELSLWAVGPDGTRVDLVRDFGASNGPTFTGQLGAAKPTITFDDEAPTAVGGATIISGAFRGAQALSAFDGKSSLGLWTIGIGDKLLEDRKSMSSVLFTITGDPTVVPLPAGITLIALGLAALGAATRRRGTA